LLISCLVHQCDQFVVAGDMQSTHYSSSDLLLSRSHLRRAHYSIPGAPPQTKDARAPKHLPAIPGYSTLFPWHLPGGPGTPGAGRSRKNEEQMIDRERPMERSHRDQRQPWQAMLLALLSLLCACSAGTGPSPTQPGPPTAARPPTEALTTLTPVAGPGLETPAGIGPGERWIEVSLPEQVVRLHDGAGVVAEYLAAAGVGDRPEYTTYPGVFQVRRKYAGPVETAPGVYVTDILEFDLEHGNGIRRTQPSQSEIVRTRSRQRSKSPPVSTSSCSGKYVSASPTVCASASVCASTRSLLHSTLSNRGAPGARMPIR